MTDHRIPLQEGKVEKGAATRDGFKPTAPHNLVLPKPTNVPQPPKPQEKK